MDNRLYNQTQKHTLSASISLSDTSITLSSFNFPDGTAIVSGDLGTLNFATLEPGTTREESITFTGVTGTTLTGVTRGIRFDAPYTQDTALRVGHSAGAILVLSNTAAFYDSFANKENDETINGIFSFATVPNSTNQAVSGDDLVNLTQLNAAATGSANIDRLIIAGNAGETLVAGNWVFLDPTDSEWKKTDASATATTDIIKIGIAQGAGVDGGAIANGILISGLDTNQTGLTANNIFFLSDTAGEITSTPGTIERPIGIAISTTQIVLDPYFRDYLTAQEKDAAVGSNGTPSSTNKYITQSGIQQLGAENFGVSAVGTDAYAFAYSPAITSLTNALHVWFEADVANTSDATFNANALGAKAITKLNDQPLTTGDIEVGQIVELVFDSSADAWQMVSQVASISVTAVKKLEIITTPVTVTNTSTETNLLSVSIPANTLGTDNGIRFKLNISDYDSGGGADDLTIRVKYGATTVVTRVLSAGNQTNDEGFIEGVLFANGATNSQKGVLNYIIEDKSSTSRISTRSSWSGYVFGTSAEDSTGALNFVISVQWGRAIGIDVITMDSALIEIIE